MTFIRNEAAVIDVESTEATPRKTYTPPTLVSIGTVSALTLTVSKSPQSEQTSKNGSMTI